MKEVPTYFTDEHAISMTLHDYFAAKAMQSLILVMADSLWEDIAQRAWDCADVMIEMRGVE